MDLGFWSFMAEAEGYDELISTRTAKINALIKDLNNCPYIIDNDVLNQYAAKHNLTYLTEEELQLIKRKVY